MSYSVIPQQYKIEYKTPNGQVEYYSLREEPAANLSLVAQSKQRILRELSLQTVIDNTKLTADLMYVSYCALAGTMLQSKMSGLQQDLMRVCTETHLSAGVFQDQTNTILTNILRSFKYLFEGKEKLTVSMLQRCARSASLMATECKKVGAAFDKLSADAGKVLQDSLDLRSKTRSAVDDFDVKRQELIALETEQKSKHEQLNKKVSELENKFNEAKKKEYQEYDNAIALSFMSTLFSAVGAGVGGAAGSLANPSAALGAVSGSASSFGDGISRISSIAESKAGSIREEKMAYLGKQLELETQNIEVLSQLKKIAIQLEHVAEQKNATETAVKTLNIAVSALKAIAVSLEHVYIFWRQMESYCSGLADVSVQADIEAFQDMSLEDRLIEYADPFFMMSCIEYITKWVALREVCKEYALQSASARDRARDNFAKSPTIEQALDLAPKLAAKFIKQIDEEIKESQEEIQQLRQAQQN